ncbi:glutathione S-transferase [Leptodontidium sp. MPI-SDFR-AT-0119]|nr:glutathione S-transferase [Leptodontidium sp. MPI-SDFR-AT-0119]
MAEPTGLIAKSGIELLSFATANSSKVSILLEELNEAYGKPEYTCQAINILKNTQKQAWYTAICPNGRIPAIVDHDRGDFVVFEGLAILSYLTKHYDSECKLSFPYDSDDYSVCQQWMVWQQSGIGPMQGQANHFPRFSKEKIPYAVQRYVGETERLYGVLDTRLKDRDYVAGSDRGRFSIADISLLGWVGSSYLAGIDLKMFPNVKTWFKRCSDRPGVQRGLSLPFPSPFRNEAFEKRLESGEEGLKETEDALMKFIEDAKKQYNYKYASP